MFRFARVEDADAVAPLIFQAMEEIVYKFISKEDKTEGIDFIKQLFIKPNNQYSYQNTIVLEENSKVLGSLVFYDGAKLKELREPVLQYIRECYNKEIEVEDETQAGEVYIDTLSVAPKEQGKGIGTRLLKYLVDYLTKTDAQQVGLLVYENNPQAEKLYAQLGFREKNIQTLAGENYKHMVLALDKD